MVDYFQRLYTLFAYEDLLLIFIAIIIGLVIGAEREYKNKTAGLRTLMLVAVGSCIFTILSIKIGVGNPDRLAANIITGIGFLGAGAIFKDENKINGITTACTIWITAALGMCIGSGHIFLGVISTAVVLFVLLNLVTLEKWIDRTHKIHTYKITTRYESGIIESFEKTFSNFHLESQSLSQIKAGDTITINWRLTGNKKHHDKLSAFLFNDASIHKIEI